MKILLLGGGGREHALAWKIAQSKKCSKLFIAPGNAGTANCGENIDIKADDFEGLKNFCVDNTIDIVVVGPEDPLVKGIYDDFKNDERTKDIPVIGPSKAGAVLEGSKDFAKGFMQRHNIPTAKYQTFDGTNIEEGLKFLETLKAPYVLKADGLCAGKGVLILPTLEEAKKEFQEMLDQFIQDFDNSRVKTLLSGEYDSENAIIKLNAGAGGTEACDWCGMLYRMYSRWAEKKGFALEVLDYLDGDEAGVKSVTFQVNGENAYGYLKSEKGVHRLVRISPFNAAGKRQTSFVSCDVMPDIKKDLDVEINDDDIRIDTYRSSGAGGQHINKTSSAIRITHFPTGIVVQCQNERSQHMNKDKAMQMLKAKLYLLKQQEAEEKLSGIRGEVTDIGWGNQIRSYVLQPYTMVKDHRTNEETGNVDAVLDGGIDIFINAYLKWIALAKKKE